MSGSSYFQLLNPIILLIFAGGFAAIHFADRRLSAPLWLAVAYSTGAVAFLLDFFVRDALGPYWGSYVSNVPFMLALVFIAFGVHARCGSRLPIAMAAAIMAATFSAVTAVLLHDPESFARAMAMNAGSGLAYGLALPPLWKRYREGTARGFERILFWLFALNVVQSFARPIIVGLVVGFGTPVVSYSDSLYALTLHFVSAIAAISLATTLLFSMGLELVGGLSRRAAEDPMTGLLNRRGLDEAVADTLEETATGTPPFSVVVCDIDHFKRVNDSYGHAAGDQVIVAFARLLERETRRADRVARLGGEEFVVCLHNADERAARLFAEARRAAFAAMEHDALPDGSVCTASFGIAERRPHETLASMIERADVALYQAKRDGRNRVRAAVRPAPEVQKLRLAVA